MVNLLLEAGADIEANVRETWGQDRILIFGGTPLHFAAKNSNMAVAELLLDWGAATNASTLNGYTPLRFAAQSSNQEMVALLLDRGAGINAKGNTLLHFAVMEKREALTTLLLERGADRKATNSSGNTPCQEARKTGAFVGTPLIVRLCRP